MPLTKGRLKVEVTIAFGYTMCFDASRSKKVLFVCFFTKNGWNLSYHKQDLLGTQETTIELVCIGCPYPALPSIHSTTCFDLCPKETMMNESQSNDVQNLFDTMVSLFV